MRFARVAAAFVFLCIVLTPIKNVLRFAAVPAGTSGWFAAVAWGAIYLSVLVAVYVALLGLFYAVRYFLVFSDEWRGPLADLDQGIRGGWPPMVGLVVGVMLLLGVVVAGNNQQWPALMETVAVVSAVVVAVTGASAQALVDDCDPLPEPVVPAPSPVPSPGPEPTDDVIPLSMAWYFHKEPGALGLSPVHHEIRIEASKGRYQALMGVDHSVSRSADYGRFVRDGLTPEVEATARELRRISREQKLTTVCEINNALAFAQRFRYATDLEEKGVVEYPKFPLETMVDDRGDCEDHAIVAAACLTKLGYEVRLVLIDYGTSSGHMALAVAGAEELPEGFALCDPISGRRFYYCEATTDGGAQNPSQVAFRMGEVPERDRKARMELITIE